MSNQRDDLIHALCKCNHTKQFLNELFKLIDPYNRFSSGMEIEDFLFGVENAAQNVIMLLLKNIYTECKNISITIF